MFCYFWGHLFPAFVQLEGKIHAFLLLLLFMRKAIKILKIYNLVHPLLNFLNENEATKELRFEESVTGTGVSFTWKMLFFVGQNISLIPHKPLSFPRLWAYQAKTQWSINEHLFTPHHLFRYESNLKSYYQGAVNVSFLIYCQTFVLLRNRWWVYCTTDSIFPPLGVTRGEGNFYEN